MLYTMVLLKETLSGCILPLIDDHTISFSSKLGATTNNCAKLMAFNLLLQLFREQGLSQLHIYGDLLLVIN